jgi:hypothetical protein
MSELGHEAKDGSEPPINSAEEARFCDDITLRVKTNVGIWTIKVKPSTTIYDIMSKLRDEHKASFVREFTKDVGGNCKLPHGMTIAEAGLKDNDMIFTQVKLW